MLRRISTFLALVLVIGACSGGDSGSPAPSSTTTVPITVLPTTTTTSPASPGFLIEVFEVDGEAITGEWFVGPVEVDPGFDGDPLLVITADDLVDARVGTLDSEWITGMVTFSMTADLIQRIDALVAEYYYDLVFRLEVGDRTVWGWMDLHLSSVGGPVTPVIVYLRLEDDRFLGLDLYGAEFVGAGFETEVYEAWLNAQS